MQPTKIYAVEKIVAKPQQIEAVKELVQAAAERTRREPGCHQLEAFQSQENPAEFVVFVIFANREAAVAHRSAAWHKEITSQLSAGLVETQEGTRGHRIA